MSRKLYKYSLYELLPEMNFADISNESGVIISGSDMANQLTRYDERSFISASSEAATAAAALSSIYSLFAHTHTADFSRMYEALTAEYKPLENYSMVESGTDKHTTDRDYTRVSTDTIAEGGTSSTDTTNERTDDLKEVATHTGTISEESTRTDDLKEVATHTGTVSTEGSTTGKTTDGTTTTITNDENIKDDGASSETNNVAAYDSATLVAHDSKSGTSTNERTATATNTTTHAGDIDTTATSFSAVTNDTTDSTANTGTVTNSSTQTNDTTDSTANTGTVSESGTSKFTRNLTSTGSGNITDTDDTQESGEHRLTRSGNIGVTTSQQMLTSEISLRARNQLIYYVAELFVSQYLVW